MVEYYDIYNKMRDTSVFAGVYNSSPAPEGFFKPTILTVPGEPEEFDGDVTLNTPDSAALVYETKVFVYGVWMDRNLLEKTDAMSRGKVSRILAGIAKKSIGHLDKRLTTLLLTGESAGSIAGGAFFSATAAIPGGATFDNLVGTSVSGSAAEVLAAYRAAQSGFLAMRGAGNDLTRNGIPRVGVMYDPRAVNGVLIHKSIQDALDPDVANDVKSPKGDGHVLMPNGYFSGSIADIWFWDLDATEKAFEVGWQQQPILESNVGQRGSDMAILSRRHYFVTSWAYECAFANNQSGILGNDA